MPYNATPVPGLDPPVFGEDGNTKYLAGGSGILRIADTLPPIATLEGFINLPPTGYPSSSGVLMGNASAPGSPAVRIDGEGRLVYSSGGVTFGDTSSGNSGTPVTVSRSLFHWAITDDGSNLNLWLGGALTITGARSTFAPSGLSFGQGATFGGLLDGQVASGLFTGQLGPIRASSAVKYAAPFATPWLASNGWVTSSNKAWPDLDPDAIALWPFSNDGANAAIATSEIATGPISVVASTPSSVTLEISPCGGSFTLPYGPCTLPDSIPYLLQWFQSTTPGAKGTAITGVGPGRGPVPGRYTVTGLTPGVTHYFTCTVGDVATERTYDTPQLGVTIGLDGAISTVVPE